MVAELLTNVNDEGKKWFSCKEVTHLSLFGEQRQIARNERLKHKNRR